MGSNHWIARVVRLAQSLRPNYWGDGPLTRSAQGWRNRCDLRPDGLAVRRLEDRRVLNAQIQSLVLPTAAVEGDTVEVSAEATGFGSLTFDWTITRDSTVIARGFTKDFSFEAPDDGAYDVSLVVTDSAYQVFDVKTGQFTVANSAPSILNPLASTINENGVTTLTGVIDDPGASDTFTLQINWGDVQSPNNTQTINLAGPLPTGATFDPETRAFSVQHKYLDDNPTGVEDSSYQIELTVTDDAGDMGQTTTSVLVENVAPTVKNLVATPIGENQSSLLSGVISDPGTRDTFKLEINWGDPLSPDNVQTIDFAVPTPGVTFDVKSKSFTVEHQYLDDNPSGTSGDSYSVSVKVIDDDGGSTTKNTSVAVGNVAPMLADVTATNLDEGGATTLAGKIVDPGTLDTYTLTVLWGDGTQNTYNYAAGTTEFSETHTYADDNPTGTPSDLVTIKLTLADDDTGQDEHELAIAVANVAPTLVGLAATGVNENQKTVLTGKIVDPGKQDSYTLAINWGDPLSPGNVQTINLAAPLPPGVVYDAMTGEFSAEHLYLDDNPTATTNDEYTITVKVTDDDTGYGEAATTVEVTNAAPTLEDVTAGDVDENGVATLSGKIVDPGTLDTFTLTVNWADGTVEEYTTTPGGAGIDLLNPPAGVTYDPLTREFTIEHQYLDDDPTATASDPYEVRLTLVDDDTDMAVDATTITVSNVAPMVVELSATSILENGTTILTGTIIDPGTLDAHSLEINWGDPLSPGNVQSIDLTVVTPGVMYDPLTREFAIEHQYLDDNPTATGSDNYTISVKVIDDDTGASTTETTVEVTNVAPEIDELTNAVIEEGDKFALYDGVVDDHTAAAVVVSTFTDFGTLDTHTAEVNWGDGTATESLDVDQLAGGGGLFGSHIYADNGLYTVTLTVTDDDGGTDEATFTVTVLNVDPELTGTDGHEVFEGDPVTLSGLGVGITDPGFDNPLNTLDPMNGGETEETFTGVMIDWGDGSPTELVDIVDRVSGSPGVPTTAGFSHDAHYYADDGVYTVSVTLRDDDGQNVTRTFEITVENVAPTLVLTDEMFVINEGEVLMTPQLGMFTDPGADNLLNPNGASEESHYYTIDWGDGTIETMQLPVSIVDGGAGVGTSGELSNQHFYADNDTDSIYTITVTLYDDDGGSHQQSIDITVHNVNPSWVPLTEAELIDDEYMAGLFADAKDIEGDGLTVFVVHFTDPGADEFEVWIDWGDKLALPDGDPRFVPATPINTVTTEKGIALYFAYAYLGPPDPADPAAEIEVTAIVVDDDYLAANAGQLVIAPETVFLTEPGRSEPVSALATNPGLDAGGVAIDTRPEVAMIEFPQLDEYVEPIDQQNGVVLGLQTQDAPSGGGDAAASTERIWELRYVTPDGKVSQPFQLKPDVMDNLPELFVKLPDGQYLIFLVRTENNTRRLALDIYIRNGKPIDIADDSDGARDKPPTTEEGDLDPAAEQIEIQIDSLEPTMQDTSWQPESLPNRPGLEQGGGRQLGGLLSVAGVAAVLGRSGPRRAYRDELEEAFEHTNPKSWRMLGALRRRPR